MVTWTFLSLSKCKIQIKIQHRDLLTFFLFVINDGTDEFVICQLYTIIAGYSASKY